MLARIAEIRRPVKWSRERIKEERQRRLRELIRVAKEKSPWHRKRLDRVDAESVTEADLEDVPVMTKADLMSNFNEITTDDQLTLDVVNAHVSGLTGDKYLLDRYHVVASGGTSGVRGVFVYDWKELITSILSVRPYFLSMNPVLVRLLALGPIRRRVANSTRSTNAKSRPKGGSVVVLADIASHWSNSITHTFAIRPTTWLPATLPIQEIVQGLNSLQPKSLSIYPSILNQLALEAKAGRLHIKPKWIGTGGEPLSHHIREIVREVWNIPVINGWGASEAGCMAWSCEKSEGMHLNEDLYIVEPVDSNGRPVPPGVRASKVYLTNLVNLTMPLIRYEITDEVTFLDGEPCPCGSTLRRIEDIQGRQDDMFDYGEGVRIHPLVFWSTFEHYPAVVEYQVRQTPRGVSVSLVTNGPIQVQQLEADLRRNLEKSGLKNPEVSANVVAKLERTAGVAKLKRFVPLQSSGPKMDLTPDVVA